MRRAVVWIDHKEARIVHVHPEAADEATIFSPQHHIHAQIVSLLLGQKLPATSAGRPESKPAWPVGCRPFRCTSAGLHSTPPFK
jgi:hypothetical protein